MDNGWGKQKSKKVESEDALKCIRVKALKSELGPTMDGGNKRAATHWLPIKGHKSEGGQT
jgi:hypothetical protein